MTSKQAKPFQFGLASVLVVTTCVAALIAIWQAHTDTKLFELILRMPVWLAVVTLWGLAMHRVIASLAR